MIPTTNNNSKKNDSVSKPHVSDVMVPDSIIPPILEESSSLSAEFTAMKNIVEKLTSALEGCINCLAALEDRLAAPPDLHQTPDPSLLSFSGKGQHLSTHLTHCELNHESVIQKFYNYKKDMHDFLKLGTPSYINCSNLPYPSHV